MNRKRRMHEMKNRILSFALPLLLALPSAAIADARLLWTAVDAAAVIVAEDGTETAASQYQVSEKAVNAFRVAVPDATAPGGTNHLVFAYEDASGSMVVDEEGGPDARPADLANGGAAWAPVGLAAYDDPDLAVTMELGYVDWTAFADGYDAGDPETWTASFEALAVATETLGSLLGAPHASVPSDLNPPALTPWSPDRFTATTRTPVRARPMVISVQ